MEILRISGILLRVIGFYLLSSVFTAVLIVFFFGEAPDFRHLNNDEVQLLLIAQGVGMFLGFIALPLAYIYLLKPSLKTIFKGMNGKDTIYVAFFSLLAILIGGPLIMTVQEWNQAFPFPPSIVGKLKAMEDAAKVLTELMVYQPTAGGFILAAIVIGIIPAVAEELVFRGIMHRELKEERWNPHVIIWVTAIVFSAIHLQFFGFFPRMLLGAMMGYLALWTGSLSAPMIFHCVNNLSTLAAYNLYKYKNIGPHPEETGFSWYTVLGSAFITFVLIYFIKSVLDKPKPEEEANTF